MNIVVTTPIFSQSDVDGLQRVACFIQYTIVAEWKGVSQTAVVGMLTSRCFQGWTYG